VDEIDAKATNVAGNQSYQDHMESPTAWTIKLSTQEINFVL